jgi:hypothetical protein
VLAHMWLDLVASELPPSGKEQRNTTVDALHLVASKMSLAQLAEARQLAFEWMIERRHRVQQKNLAVYCVDTREHARSRASPRRFRGTTGAVRHVLHSPCMLFVPSVTMREASDALLSCPCYIGFAVPPSDVRQCQRLDTC